MNLPKISFRNPLSMIGNPFKFGANSGGYRSANTAFLAMFNSLKTSANAAKEVVTPETSMQLSAYYAAIRNISEDIAKQPIELIQLEKNGNIKILINDPIQRLLAVVPNEEMSPFTLIETITSHALGWGNGYAEIVRNGAGKPVALFPIHPSRVQVERDKETGQIIYKIFTTGKFSLQGEHRHDNSEAILNPEDIIHIKGLGGDGLTGYSVVNFASQSFGSAIAAQKFSAAYFGNGTSAGGFLKTPNQLSKEARDNLVKSFEDRSKGAENSHKLQLLEEGLEWQNTTIHPKESQLVELRKFQVTDVARWFRMPPTKIGDFDRATFSNVEQTNIDYNTDTLSPWATKIEQELKIKLLLNRSKVFVRFNEDALLRGDSKSRAEKNRIYWEIGVKSPNEIRRSEGMNSYAEGDDHYRPLNFAVIGEEPEMQTIEQPKEVETTKETIEEPMENTESNATDFAPIIADAVARVNDKERKAVSRQEKKEMTKDERVEWAKKFFNSQENYFIDAIMPIFNTLAVAMSADFIDLISVYYENKVESFINSEEQDAIDDKLINIILNEL